MVSGLATSEKQAEILKDAGNSYVKKGRIGAAIEAYTEAITLCPTVPVYWTNRALCYRKRNEWQRVEADCRKALELDKGSVKAHYMLGLALLQSQLYGDAVKQLEKALELGRGSSLVEDIWLELAKAKYSQWEYSAKARAHQQSELRRNCERLLRKDYVEQAEEDSGSSDTWNSVELDGVIYLDKDDYVRTAVRKGLIDPPWASPTLTEQYKNQLVGLAHVFDAATAADRPAEIPDHLQCKITMDIFRDPVITPSGVTYERAVLLEHLRKVGKFDPLTRAPLQPDQVVPNLAIKEAVQTYLKEHGWAYRTMGP